MSLKILKPLSDGEEFELTDCEEKIEANLSGFWDCLFSFSKIRELKLWRKHYESFEEYCEQRWDITSRRMNQLIKAHEVKTSLPKEFAKLITNAAQAAAVANVPEEQREEVLEEASRNGDITANGITEAAETVTATTPAPVRVLKKLFYDEIGEIIPDEALPFWHRKQEVQDLMTSITRIKTHLSEAIKKEDPMFARMGNGIIVDINALYTSISEAKPYTVCSQCMGFPSMQPHGCGYCRNKGLISKFQWEHNTPQEIRNIRLAAIADRQKNEKNHV
jgi:truncated hemoglobin YjbI